MNRDFDVFIKQHLQDILCQAEKEHTLAMIRKSQMHQHKPVNHTPHHHFHIHDVHVEDCAISPNFSQSHL